MSIRNKWTQGFVYKSKVGDVFSPDLVPWKIQNNQPSHLFLSVHRWFHSLLVKKKCLSQHRKVIPLTLTNLHVTLSHSGTEHKTRHSVRLLSDPNLHKVGYFLPRSLLKMDPILKAKFTWNSYCSQQARNSWVQMHRVWQRMCRRQDSLMLYSQITK